jgi:hypothetical protein
MGKRINPMFLFSLRTVAILIGLSLLGDSIAHLPVKKTAVADFERVASSVLWIVIGLGLTNVGLLFGFRNYPRTTTRIVLAIATVITVPISLAVTLQLWNWWRS